MKRRKEKKGSDYIKKGRAHLRISTVQPLLVNPFEYKRHCIDRRLPF